MVKVDKHVLNGKMKKRYRYLEHVPTYAQIAFVDVDMTKLLRPKYFDRF